MTNLQKLVQEFYDIGCDLRVSIFIDYLDKDKEEIDIGRYDPEQWDGTISPEQNIDKILEELKEKYCKMQLSKVRDDEDFTDVEYLNFEIAFGFSRNEKYPEMEETYSDDRYVVHTIEYNRIHDKIYKELDKFSCVLKVNR